jgi:hypothetical protein
MAVITDPKLNGAELLRELVKTGTSDAKLALARQVLAFVHRAEKRVASAAELIEAMEKAGRMEPFLKDANGHPIPPTPDLTLKKALVLATTGAWNGPVEERAPTVEELILAGQPVPEAPKPSAVEAAVSAPPPEANTRRRRPRPNRPPFEPDPDHPELTGA